MPTHHGKLTIGEVVRRSGVAHSALRFYEQRGLIHADRTTGNQRRYPREVLRRVIETGASAIILVHNHPSGDPSPSKADIAMTKELIAALGTIGGVLHDHVIVGRNRELSFRKAGLI